MIVAASVRLRHNPSALLVSGAGRDGSEVEGTGTSVRGVGRWAKVKPAIGPVFVTLGWTGSAIDGTTAGDSDGDFTSLAPKRSASSFAFLLALSAAASRSCSSARRLSLAFSAAECISAVCESTPGAVGTAGVTVSG